MKTLARFCALLERNALNMFIIIIMALQPFVGPWQLFQFLDLLHGR
jgi:hypothetical protein